MKLWLYALAMCQSMFIAIPFPWNLWEERARDKMLLCLPVIGLEIGLIWWGMGALCRYFALPAMIAACILCAAPYLVTGYMHLDGFMDVTDAVRSYRSLERRREILKDSHVGSFSVIGFGIVLLVQFAAAASLKPETDLRVLLLIPAVSRCGSVLAIQCLPSMSTSQYAGCEKHQVFIPIAFLVVSLAAGYVCFGKYAFALIGCVAGFLMALLRAYKSLQGMNGDISGYCITLSEMAAMLVLALL